MYVTPSQKGAPLRDRSRRYNRHCNSVEPMMIAKDRKATLQTIRTEAIKKGCHERNVVLDGRPPPISNSEK